MLTARVPDLNDRAVKIAYVCKAIYRLCKENETGIVTIEEIYEWLNKYDHHIGDMKLVREMIIILWERGMLIVHYKENEPNSETWEWSLEQGKIGQPIITKKKSQHHTATHQS